MLLIPGVIDDLSKQVNPASVSCGKGKGSTQRRGVDDDTVFVKLVATVRYGVPWGIRQLTLIKMSL
jgi:hypothetical protein